MMGERETEIMKTADGKLWISLKGAEELCIELLEMTWEEGRRTTLDTFRSFVLQVRQQLEPAEDASN